MGLPQKIISMALSEQERPRGAPRGNTKKGLVPLDNKSLVPAGLTPDAVERLRAVLEANSDLVVATTDKFRAALLLALKQCGAADSPAGRYLAVTLTAGEILQGFVDFFGRHESWGELGTGISRVGAAKTRKERLRAVRTLQKVMDKTTEDDITAFDKLSARLGIEDVPSKMGPLMQDYPLIGPAVKDAFRTIVQYIEGTERAINANLKTSGKNQERAITAGKELDTRMGTVITTSDTIVKAEDQRPVLEKGLEDLLIKLALTPATDYATKQTLAAQIRTKRQEYDTLLRAHNQALDAHHQSLSSAHVSKTAMLGLGALSTQELILVGNLYMVSDTLYNIVVGYVVAARLIGVGFFSSLLNAFVPEMFVSAAQVADDLRHQATTGLVIEGTAKQAELPPGKEKDKKEKDGKK